MQRRRLDVQVILARAIRFIILTVEGRDITLARARELARSGDR